MTTLPCKLYFWGHQWICISASDPGSIIWNPAKETGLVCLVMQAVEAESATLAQT